MAHLLIIELPGGECGRSDSDIAQAALARGDRYTLVSAQLARLQGLPAMRATLHRAQACIEAAGLGYEALEQRVLQAHAADPFDAVLCLVAGRTLDAARLAQALKLRFLNPASAALLCDPGALRRRLLARGLWPAQPADGDTPHDLPGILIGCDTRTEAGRHTLLGVHEKQRFDAPCAALRGSTFTPNRAGFEIVERQVFDVLDALDFDFGAAHIEILLHPRGPQVLRVDAPLAGAGTARLLGYATGRPVHQDLIALHCGQARAAGSGATPQVAVLRWMASDREGLLDEIVTPVWHDPAIRCVEMQHEPGDWVRPPLADTDRLGYVLVCGPSRADAEDLAGRYVARTQVRLREPDPTLVVQATPAGLEFKQPARCAPAQAQTRAPAAAPAYSRAFEYARPWPTPLKNTDPPDCSKAAH